MTDYKFVAYVRNYKTSGCDMQLWTQDFRHLDSANGTFEDRHIVKVYPIDPLRAGLGMAVLADLYPLTA